MFNASAEHAEKDSRSDIRRRNYFCFTKGRVMSKKRLLFSLNVSLQKTGARKGCSLLLTKLQDNL